MNFVYEGQYYDKILRTSGAEIISHFMHVCMLTYTHTYIVYIIK